MKKKSRNVERTQKHGEMVDMKKNPNPSGRRKTRVDDDRPLALLDMDGTVAAYDAQMIVDLEKLRSPIELMTKFGDYTEEDYDAPYMQARMQLIKARGEWWENLPKRQLGFDIVELLKKHDFRIHVLTQGPRTNPTAWSHKVSWCMKNLPGIEVTITRDKSLSYGRILVDDYPDYIKGWLKWRPRGLVIMPQTRQNADFTHPNVICYDGTNKKLVESHIIKAKNRKAGKAS